ncbi:hypothetical protein CLOM_g24185 [Closterium sp. NIES-68]|nr:hypothetical protein CLOM_g24185 [Closterium sp. NIES-68]
MSCVADVLEQAPEAALAYREVCVGECSTREGREARAPGLRAAPAAEAETEAAEVEVEVDAAACSSGNGVSVRLLLSDRALAASGWAHLCWSASDLASSLQTLRPAQRVLRQLAAEDLPRVQRSTAVFLENTPLDSCPGCPANLSLLIPPSCTNCRTRPFTHSLSSCAARRIAYSALRHPERDFTVAATVPAAALTAAGMFHESRAPLVLEATRRRGELGCGAQRWGGGWGWNVWGEVGGVGGMNIWGRIGRGGGSKMWGRRSGWLGNVLERGQLGRGGWGRWWLQGVFGQGRKEQCAELELVELLALAHAPSRFSLRQASLESLLLSALAPAARGPHSPPAVEEPAVCPSPVLPLLASLRLVQQMIMDEKLGLMYCQVEKVAGTSWKMWMRSERGFKNVASYFHTHHAPVSGLTLMRRGMGEDEVVYHLTRRDLLKFVFVRNPLPRLLSAHGDKLVNGGESRNVTMWNELIFGRDRLQRWGLEPSSSVSFKVAAHMAAEILRETGGNGDHHIASQLQLCGLDMMKYDIVGRYENLQEDVQRVVTRLNRSTERAMEIFKLGSQFHKTRAEQRMRAAFDKETIKLVESAYAVDFDVPLNNIRYSVPDVLQDTVGRELS